MTAKHRYEMSYTAIHHPWKQRRNTMTGVYEPKVVEAYIVRDTWTRDYVGNGSTKMAAVHDRVRELNGMPSVSLAQIKRALRKASISLSETHTTRISGWSNWSPGIDIRREHDGTFKLDYVVRMHGKDETNVPALMERAWNALTAAGIVCRIVVEPRKHGDIFRTFVEA